MNGGYAEIDRFARPGAEMLRGDWLVCSSNMAALDAFEAEVRERKVEGVREAAEVGRCVRVSAALEPSGASVRQASDGICRSVVASRATFVSWSAALGDTFLYIHPRGWSLSRLQNGQAIRKG